MKWKIGGAVFAVLVGIGVFFLGQPTPDELAARMAPDLEARLKSREVQIDPGELLDLIYNDNAAVKILDVRDEADFNLFHIIDAERVTMDQARDYKWAKSLPPNTVLVLTSNDEKRATLAWRLLSARGVANLYILEGGINYWLDVYGQDNDPAAKPRPEGDDTMRHEFSSALGQRRPEADPDPHEAPHREYEKKVKSIGPAAKKAGGCG